MVHSGGSSSLPTGRVYLHPSGVTRNSRLEPAHQMDMLEKPPEDKFLACIPFSGGLDLSQMFSAVDTKDPTAVEVQVQAAYLSMFQQGDRLFVPRVFGWVIECFTGHYAEYQAIDARYHDLEHTLQGTLCLSRLLWARAEVGAEPSIDQREFELG